MRRFVKTTIPAGDLVKAKSSQEIRAVLSAASY